MDMLDVLYSILVLFAYLIYFLNYAFSPHKYMYPNLENYLYSVYEYYSSYIPISKYILSWILFPLPHTPLYNIPVNKVTADASAIHLVEYDGPLQSK